MKISVQKSLLLQALAPVNGATVNGTDPHDPGQYLMGVADAEAKTLTFTVAGKELVSRTVLGIGMVTEGVMAVHESGKFTFDGEPLAKSLRSHEIETTANLELQESKAKRKSAGPDSPVDDAPASVGTVVLTLPGGQGESEEYGMQCIDIYDDTIEFPTKGQHVKVGASDFIRAIKQVDVTAGKPTLSTDYCNVRLRLRDKKMEFATTTGRQVGIAKISTVEAPEGNIDVVLSQDTVKRITKLLDSTQELSLYIMPKGETQQVVFTQDIVYANGIVGKTFFKTSEPGYKFPDFDAHFAAVDFKYVYKARLTALKKLFEKIASVDTHRTQFAFDPEAKVAKISKNKGGFAKTSIPLDAASDRLEIALSDEHLSQVATVLEEEEVEMSFSGRTGLARITSGPSFVMYFSPFSEE